MVWVKPPLVQMINGEASLGGVGRVLLSIPSVDVPLVDVPLSPSICVNDDGEASLRGAVLVFLSKSLLHIPLAPSVYAPCTLSMLFNFLVSFREYCL
ncbi:hypothetical protein LguiA_021086 [Lonicera macranthoides]